MALVSALGLLAGTLASCGSTTVSITSYKTSCSAPADCAAVYIGDACGCGCANAAINSADLPRYQSDYNAARSGCHGPFCAADCINASATCTAGVCAITH